MEALSPGASFVQPSDGAPEESGYGRRRAKRRLIELTNPTARLAVQIRTEDHHMIGWAPRHLAEDLVRAIVVSSGRPCAYRMSESRRHRCPSS